MRSSSSSRSLGKLDIGLVDLVDEQHRPLVRDEGDPQLAAPDVVADVLDAGVAELAVAQARHRVVLVKALQRLGGRFHMPFEERRREALGDLDGEHGLAGTRLALDQQRPLERDRGIDGDLEVVGRHIGAGSFKAHDISKAAPAARQPTLGHGGRRQQGASSRRRDRELTSIMHANAI
jgi:hypothetical protein